MVAAGRLLTFALGGGVGLAAGLAVAANLWVYYNSERRRWYVTAIPHG